MDSDADPSIYIIDPQDAIKKRILFKKFFCIVLFEVSFTSFFKEVTKLSKSRFFLLFLLNDRRIRIHEAQKHVDPVDPDPVLVVTYGCFLFPIHVN